MFWNVIQDPEIYKCVEDGEFDIEDGKYAVFHPVLKFDDMPDYKGRSAEEVIDDLAAETGAKSSGWSGSAEGTFYFDDLTSARKAVTIIKHHLAKMCDDANKRESSATSMVA